MKYAEVLIPVFGEAIIKKLFAKAWATRDEGLQDCEEFIKKNGNDQASFQAALNVAGLAMADKIAQIITRSMNLVQATLKSSSSQLDPGSSSTIVFNQLFNKLGDNNTRIRDRAEEILVLMAGHVSFGAQIVANNIVKGQIKKTSQNSVKSASQVSNK